MRGREVKGFTLLSKSFQRGECAESTAHVKLIEEIRFCLQYNSFKGAHFND